MKLFQYLFIRLFHGILSILPFTIVRALAYPIGIIYFIFTFRSSTLLYKRRIEIFKPNDLQYNPLMVKINYSRYWLETLWLTSRNYEKSISNKIEIINFDYVKKLKKQYPGLIFALPHMGNWEFAIPAGNSLNLNLLAVAEPLSNKYVLNWFKKLRESLGIEIVIGGKGQNTFNLLVDKLASGKDICLLSDRSVNKSGVAVEFFSNIASFPKGPVALSLKTSVPIVPTAMIKMSTGYKLYFHKPFYVPLFENEATSIQQGLKTLSKSFEEILSMDINDWHSIQPVWTVEY
ncbi:MAG: lysophospholipid acyltransferase family protein [Candidatus Actinomarina sp.]